MQGVCLLSRERQIHAADCVDDLLKGVEVDAHIAIHVYTEGLANGLHGQIGAAVAEGVRQPVVVASGN